MKKKIVFFVFLFLTLFFINNDVFAKVDTSNAKVECYYGNGAFASFTRNIRDGKPVLTAIIKNNEGIAKTTVIDGDPIPNISFYKNDFAVKNMQDLVCPNDISYWVAWYVDKDNDEQKQRGVYSFDYCTYIHRGCTGKESLIADTFKDFEAGSLWLGVIGSLLTTEQTGGALALTGTNLVSKTIDGFGVVIPLVGERIKIFDDIGDDAYSHTYKLYDESGENGDKSQAVSNNSYIQVYQGKSDSGKYFLHIGSDITSIDNKEKKYLKNKYICVTPSEIQEGEPGSGESGNIFTSPRHSIVGKTTEKGTCPKGSIKYVRTTEVCKIEVGDSVGSFCEKYPNTAFVIIDIIKIMQILVPALVIILTGVEIGRIVVAGNLEEELPKRKKNMIIRFIIMVTFFFLPVIVQLIISLAEGVPMYKVDCLFNDGKEKEVESVEKNCAEPIKTDE